MTPETFNRPLLLDWRRAAFSAADLAGWLKDPASRVDLKRTKKMAELGMIEGRDERRPYDLGDGVARIKIRGPLFNDEVIDPWGGWSGYKGLSIQIAAALADPEARGLLLDIDSPGGTSAGLFDLVDEIVAARGLKPIWAACDDTAASAAYAIASAAELVFLPRLGAVGSIGVWTLHLDMSKALDDFGLKVTLIFAGKHKIDGHPFAPLPDEVRADIQTEVDQVHDLFVATVARHRDLDEAKVRATEARTYSDAPLGDLPDAVTLGLADGVAPAKEVFRALAEEVAAPQPA